MSAVCSAMATAVEWSDRTLAARARFTGAAMFALISDMAARSGRGSPARASSSSRVRRLKSSVLAMISLPSLSSVVTHLPLGLWVVDNRAGGLVDVRVLGGLGIRHRV